MAGLKFTKHSYKIQSEKRMKEKSGVGYCLKKLVSLEQILVMNDSQFRWFYEKFSGHQLIGGDDEDINCLKLSILKEMLGDIYSRIDERGVYHAEEEENQEEQYSQTV